VAAQLKSTFGPPDWTRVLRADWGSLPCFQRNWMAGSVDADDVLTLMAMLSPKAALPPLFARSGETAPFQTNRPAPPAVPDCSNEAAFGSISYQRSSAPPPPKTECAVQIATLPAWPGSTAATAASKRPSSVSSRYVLPTCGALDGIE
jgi:hypothetical protein